MKSIKIILLIFVSVIYLSLDCNNPSSPNKIQTTITGKVIDAETKSALQGVMISTEPPTEQTSTTEEGIFVIDTKVEVSQRYRVNASLTGYIPNSSEITAAEGKNTTSDIALQKEKFTTITGKVIDAETKSALQGAMISTEPPTEQTLTDDGGKFVIDLNVKVSQRYRVNASLADYIPNFSEITVSAGENTTSDITLHREKCILEVSPSVLDFGIDKISRILTIKNSGTGELNWAIKAPSESWLSLIGTLSGTITDHPQTVEVKVFRSKTTPGIHTATLAVTSNGGNSSIEVSMGVPNTNAPQLYAFPAKIDFMNSLTQTILYIRNIGTGQLDWNLSTNDSWYQIAFSSGTTTTETDEIIVTANRDQLSVGTYSGKITINSNGGTASIDVSLVVDVVPILSVNLDTLDFGETEIQSTFIISNLGGGSLNWSVKANKYWIGLYPTSGTNQSTINVSIDRTNLQNGDYSGQIDITSDGGNDNILVLMKNRTPNQPPVAHFIVAPEKGDLETTFNVNASGSTDDYDPIDSLQVRWQWETGVGFTGWTSVKTASYKYTSYGNKTITLEVKDTKGEKNTTYKVVSVIENKPPTASFTLNPTSGTTSTIFYVDASTSSDDQDATTELEVRWRWDHNENFTNWTFNKKAEHQYQSIGIKTITLEVRDKNGFVDATEKMVEVKEIEFDPVAYYPFNGNARDESGNNNDGTLCNSPQDPNLVVDRFGTENSAYYFDGDDCISLGSAEIINSDFTISAWIKASEINYGTIINKYNNISDFEFHGWYLGILPDGMIRIFIGSDGIFNFDYVEGGAVTVDKWHFIAATYNQSELKLYQNLALLKQKVNVTRLIRETPVDILIGLESKNHIDGFKGSIDDIRIYDQALTANELEKLFHENGWNGN